MILAWGLGPRHPLGPRCPIFARTAPGEKAVTDVYAACHRSVLLGAVLALLAPQASSAAYGDEPEQSVLVLRVTQGGKYHERLTAQVNDYLKRSGITLAESTGIAPEDRKCDEPRCLLSIAGRWHASLILTASVMAHQEDRFLGVSILDVNSGRNRTADEICDEAEVERRLKTITGRLVDEAKGGAPLPAAAARSPVKAPPIAVSRPVAPIAGNPGFGKPLSRLLPIRRSLPRWRRAVGGALGATALLSLGAAITLNATDGSTMQGEQFRQLLEPSPAAYAHFQGLYIGGYSLAGAALLGTVLTLAIP